MLALVGSLLVAAVIGQAQAATFQGQVVDEKSKPVAGAQVVLSAPFAFTPVVKPTQTDAEGRFHFTDPPRGALVFVWAYRPGWAITAARVLRSAPTLVLRKTRPQTLKIEDHHGQPIAGARLAPRVIVFFPDQGGIDEWVPETLTESLVATTGPDGRATIGYLTSPNRLVAVRVTAESIGTQDILIFGAMGQGTVESPITIRLKPTSRIAGRVVDGSGRPVRDQPVETWFRGEMRHTTQPNPVGFQHGTLRTAADGSFQTPDNLLVGTPYRVVVRGPGLEPVFSGWTTITEAPQTLPLMVLRSLRTITGRIVDRPGQPVAGVEVFQSGDGPERTTTTTGADGRFSLGGFRQGTVFLFVRGEGFRFHGQLVRPDESDFTIKLTRFSERPVRRMRMLPEPISLEESRALARRLIEPYWKVAVENEDIAGQQMALQSLATADPAGVLDRLQAAKFPNEGTKSRARQWVVLALAHADPETAAAVAESITNPVAQAAALLQVVDALPDAQRDRKLALLDRAAPLAKAGTAPSLRLARMGDVAECWYELGEVAKSKALFAEGLRLANQLPDKTNIWRGRFAARLARVDLPAALSIARDFPDSGRNPFAKERILRNIAFRLAAENPAEAERILRQIPKQKGQSWLPMGVAWKMVAADPERARRLIEESQRYDDRPTLFLVLALSLKSRDERAAHEAFQAAMRGIDRLTKDEVEYFALRGIRGVLLPLVEQIDPALVPELFWRAVATRPPIGNPRVLREHLSGQLVMLLAWYDREVAQALFERVRADLDGEDDSTLLSEWSREFLGWSLFDPRAAVARLEKIPLPPTRARNADDTRTQVAEFLGLPYPERWRRVWNDNTDMTQLYERDIQ